MNSNTFGSSEKYKVLPYLTDCVCRLDGRQKKYISTIIRRFHEVVKTVEAMDDRGCKNYVLSLIRKDYLEKVSRMNYPEDLLSTLTNYFVTRLKKSQCTKQN